MPCHVLPCLCRLLSYGIVPYHPVSLSYRALSSRITEGRHRHSDNLFKSLLNALLSYDPYGFGMPYGHVMVPDDSREQLAQVGFADRGDDNSDCDDSPDSDDGSCSPPEWLAAERTGHCLVAGLRVLLPERSGLGGPYSSRGLAPKADTGA